MTWPRTATIGTLAAIVGSLGCLWRPKPYTTDPLVRGRRAVLADPTSAPRGPEPHPTPTPPLPPDDATPGR